MNIQTITDQTFDRFIAVGGVAVVELGAEWCTFCKSAHDTLARLSGENPGKARFGYADIDTATGLAQRFGVTTLPTIIFFKDGKPSGELVGRGCTGKAIHKACEKLI